MSKPAFRYFDADFEPGRVVTPKSDHFPNLSAEKQRAEAAIRQGDSRGHIRGHSVFVFENREVAEELLEETDGKHLYEVIVDDGDILHRGDLRIYDEIVEALKHGRDAKPLVKEFWSAIERPYPRIELTVRKVTIRRKLVDDDQK